jgi:hypothetical protein
VASRTPAGACRECRRVLPRGRLATLHRALVPQHLQPRALDQGAGIAAMLKAIHAGESIVAAREKAIRVIEKLHALRRTRAADLVEAAVEETLAY